MRRVGLAVAVVFIGMQFIPANRANPPVESEVTAAGEVMSILRRACYDCHSNETEWPWYSYVAPASWFVTGHVNDARADLNFSEWPNFEFELQENAYRDIERQVTAGKMPLRSYTLLHPNARLDSNDRDTLVRWTRSQRSTGD